MPTPVINLLYDILSAEQITDSETLKSRQTSLWNNAPTEALAMVRPESTEQLSQILSLCNQHRQPVVTQGGLSGVVQGANAHSREIIISLEKMNQIENIDPIGGTATLQAGVILQNAQEALADENLLLPVDLGARGSCTIGGNVATNAGGINVLRYGMMRNSILGLEVVLADGTVMSSMNQILKNNAGYDLKQLFIGTEGTLGIVTRVVIRCFPLPISCQTAFAALPGFEQVVHFLKLMQTRAGSNLSAYEVLWGEHYRAITAAGFHTPPLPRIFPYYVILETQGSDSTLDKQQFNSALEQALNEGMIEDAVVPKSESERRKLWDIRENFEAVLHPVPVYLYDVSLPINHMEQYVRRVDATLKQRLPQSRLFTMGHIADGNLHFFIQPGEDGDFHQFANEAVYQPLSDYNGSVSAEHGIGLEKKSWLSHSRSETEITWMKHIKRLFDQNNILNPGRVFDL